MRWCSPDATVTLWLSTSKKPDLLHMYSSITLHADDATV